MNKFEKSFSIDPAPTISTKSPSFTLLFKYALIFSKLLVSSIKIALQFLLPYFSFITLIISFDEILNVFFFFFSYISVRIKLSTFDKTSANSLRKDFVLE